MRLTALKDSIAVAKLKKRCYTKKNWFGRTPVAVYAVYPACGSVSGLRAATETGTGYGSFFTQGNFEK